MQLFISLIIWLSILTGANSEPERKSFAVFWGDDEIGEIHADRTISDKQVHYKVHSNSDFRIVWKYNQKYQVEMAFEDGLLRYGSSKDILNKKIKKHAITTRNGDHYQRLDDAKPIDPLQEDIRFTTGLLYFQEPKGIDRVYSEHFLVFVPLQQLEDQRYKLDLPGNRTNYYTYEDGQLQHVEVARAWITVDFRRKN